MTQNANKRTSEILKDLSNDCKSGEKISVGDFTAKLGDRAFGLIVFIFGLIAGIVPGVSAIFSIPIVIISVQMIFGSQKIWLPKWLTERHMSESHLRAALEKTIPVLKFIEKFIRPRLSILTNDTAEKFVAVVLLVLSLVLLLPMPGLNIVPGAALCVIALGILEKDGLLILLGSLASIIGIWLTSVLIIKVFVASFHYVIGLFG